MLVLCDVHIPYRLVNALSPTWGEGRLHMLIASSMDGIQG